jgi:hypothetical protein
MMRIILCVLCVAMCSGIGGAQEHSSNFETCISEARQKHTDSTMDTYASYKCDGATAQKLAARPDECAAGVRPPLSRIERKSRQLEDGLYLRMTWSAQVCAGMCETRFYNDSRDAKYLCEVRRRNDDRVAQSSDQAPPSTSNRRHGNEHQSGRRWTYGPMRNYDQPDPFRRRMLETEEEARGIGRWIYGESEWYSEYSDPGNYADDYRRNDYRRAYRRGDYRRDYP